LSRGIFRRTFPDRDLRRTEIRIVGIDTDLKGIDLLRDTDLKGIDQRDTWINGTDLLRDTDLKGIDLRDTGHNETETATGKQHQHGSSPVYLGRFAILLRADVSIFAEKSIKCC
jgi:hypothetical protein